MSISPAIPKEAGLSPGGWLAQERWQVLIAALGAVVIASVMLPWLPGRDQGIESATAVAILDGAVPYRDVWNHNLPGGFLALSAAFAVFGRSPLVIRGLDVLCVAVAAGALASVARRVTSGFGWLLAPAVLVLSYVGHGDPWNTAQRDGYLLPLGAVAFALVIRSQKPRVALVAGVLVGVAALFKPAGLMLLLPVVGSLRGRGRLLAVAGALAPAALVSTYLVATGAAGAFLACAVDFNRTYAAHFDAFDGRRDATAWHVLGRFIWERPELWLALPGAFHLRSSPLRNQLLLYLGAALASPFLQAGMYPYHLLPLLAPLATLSAGAVGTTRVSGWLRSWLLVGAAVGLLVPAAYRWGSYASATARIVRGIATPAERRAAVRTPDFNYADLDAVSRVIRQHSTAGEPMLVWGIDAAVHFLSERPPVTRYPTNLPLRTDGTSEASRAAFLGQIAGRWPKFVAVQKGDVIPWMTGNRADSLTAAGEFVELRTVLERDYAAVLDRRTWLLLQRKDTIVGSTP